MLLESLSSIPRFRGLEFYSIHARVYIYMNNNNDNHNIKINNNTSFCTSNRNSNDRQFL